MQISNFNYFLENWKTQNERNLKRSEPWKHQGFLHSEGNSKRDLKMTRKPLKIATENITKVDLIKKYDQVIGVASSNIVVLNPYFF